MPIGIYPRHGLYNATRAVRALLQRTEWTQAKLALELQISHRQIARYSAGEARCSQTTYHRLMDLLNACACGHWDAHPGALGCVTRGCACSMFVPHRVNRINE